MWKYNCKKRNQYYDAAIRLYIHENTSSVTKTGDSEVKALQAEIRRLKKELAYESLRANAFNELINVAEKNPDLYHC